MLLFSASTPKEYQAFFYQEIGLTCTKKGEFSTVWEHPEIGFVNSCGSLEQIQSGLGNYTVPLDFFVEYQYDSVYLHFGIIYEGITYSVSDNHLIPAAVPSSFLALEKASGRINHWKCGQHFQGIELSIEYDYLTTVLLPFLGYPPDAVSFLESNVRYVHLPEEMRALLQKLEILMSEQRLTSALQLSVSLELLSFLLHPDNRNVFCCLEPSFSKQIQLGKRYLCLTSEDFGKIVRAREYIQTHSADFPNSYVLSRKLKISEQKLKAGFFDLYRQTIWDYANSVRMNTAAQLLRNTELDIRSVSRNVGYQSQTAFINMFKKWSGSTPRQFRMQTRTMETAG